MKNIITCLFLISPAFGFSQIKVNIQGGLNISSFDIDLMTAYGFDLYRQELIDDGWIITSQINNSIRPGGFIGLEVDLYTSKKSFIKSGVKYTTSGDSYYFTTSDIQYQSGFTNSDARIIWRPRLDYVAIPFNYGIKMNKFSCYLGAVPHITVGNMLRYNYYEVNSAYEVVQRWDRVDDLLLEQNVVVFLNGGANYVIPYADSDLILSVNVSYSLNTVYEELIYEIHRARLLSFELGFGVVL